MLNPITRYVGYLEQVLFKCLPLEETEKISRETQYHLQDLAAEFATNGVSQDAAEQMAIERFGPPLAYVRKILNRRFDTNGKKIWLWLKLCAFMVFLCFFVFDHNYIQVNYVAAPCAVVGMILYKKFTPIYTILAAIPAFLLLVILSVTARPTSYQLVSGWTNNPMNQVNYQYETIPINSVGQGQTPGNSAFYQPRIGYARVLASASGVIRLRIDQLKLQKLVEGHVKTIYHYDGATQYRSSLRSVKSSQDGVTSWEPIYYSPPTLAQFTAYINKKSSSSEMPSGPPTSYEMARKKWNAVLPEMCNLLRFILIKYQSPVLQSSPEIVSQGRLSYFLDNAPGLVGVLLFGIFLDFVFAVIGRTLREQKIQRLLLT